MKRRPQAVQVGVFTVCLVFLAWSLAGLIANPDFSTGSHLTSKQVLGVDFNGWHAVSGFLLFVPGLVFAARRKWALPFAWLAAAALIVSGVGALLDKHPAGLFPFEHPNSDAILHFAGAAAFIASALADRLQRPAVTGADRRGAPSARVRTFALQPPGRRRAR